MAPYIAALVLLIVAVLFLVYKRVDGFQARIITITKDTPVKQMIDFDKQTLAEATALKEKLDAAPPFDDGATQEKLSELGLQYIWTRDEGLQYEKPFSKLLSKKLDSTIDELNKGLAQIQSAIDSGKVSDSASFEQALKAMGAPEIDYNAFNIFANLKHDKYQALKNFINEKLGSTGSTAAVTSSSSSELTCPGGRMPFAQNGKVYCRNLDNTVSAALTCPAGTNAFFVMDSTPKFICLSPTDPLVVNPGSALSGGQLGCSEDDTLVMNISNNSQKCIPKTSASKASSGSSAGVAGVSAEDLFKAVGGVQQALKASKPAGIEKVEAPAPEPSLLSTKEMEERIAKNVATQLKDSLMVQRATKDVVNEMPCPYASYQSDATAQGTEFTQARPHPAPDMSEYVRKDSIPCWNCSLP